MIIIFRKKYVTMIILLSIIVIMILNTGCSGMTPATQTYNTGRDGLIIDFSEANPESVYEREEFGQALLIKNEGSTDVLSTNPAVLKINYDSYRMYGVGGYFDEQDLRIDRYTSMTVQNIAIYGKSREYPVGDEKAAAFYFVANSLTRLREGATTEINYNLCYPYTTELSTMTCIDTKGYKTDYSPAACKSTTYSGAAGQGGPIVITKVEPEILLQSGYVRPQFKIYVENLGTGYVTSNHRCGEVDLNDREYSGRVNVEAWLSEQELECGPDGNGNLRLVDGDSFIRCSLSQENDMYPTTQKNYITPLRVKIDYTYTIIDELEIGIKRNDLLKDNTSQGLCGSYEVEYGNTCVSKCRYCAEHPGDSICAENVPSGFSFNENFGCSCDLAACNAKQDKGSCIKGYCSGGTYCCSINKCDLQQIEYNGKCINKCDYCRSVNASDYTICRGLNFVGYSCKDDINKTQCTSAGGQCRTGYCGGDDISKYCASENIATYLREHNLTG